MIFCPETFPVVWGHEPCASSALDDGCDSVHMKNARGVFIMVNQHNSNASTAIVLTVHEGATDAACKAGTNELSASSSQSFMIWSNLDCATNDTMVRRSDAVTYTVTASAATMNMVCIYVPAAILTDGMEYINLGSATGHASNIVSVHYVLDKPRYQQVTPPTAVA